MGIHVDTSEVRALALDLAKAPATIQRRASQAIRKTALDIERDGKANIISMDAVDTGNMLNSMGSDISLLSAEIGPTASYSIYVHDGTSRMAPRPFLAMAFDRRIGPLQQALGNAVEDIL